MRGMSAGVVAPLQGRGKGHGGVYGRQDWWLGVWQDHDKFFPFTLLQLTDHGILCALKTVQCFGLISQG